MIEFINRNSRHSFRIVVDHGSSDGRGVNLYSVVRETLSASSSTWWSTSWKTGQSWGCNQPLCDGLRMATLKLLGLLTQQESKAG